MNITTKTVIYTTIDPKPFKTSWEALEILKKNLEPNEIEFTGDGEGFIITHDKPLNLTKERLETLFQMAIELKAEREANTKWRAQNLSAPILTRVNITNYPHHQASMIRDMEAMFNQYKGYHKRQVEDEAWDSVLCTLEDMKVIADVHSAIIADDWKKANQLMQDADTALRDNFPENVWTWANCHS